jgi:PAS domain S-box-containing protein
LAFERLLANLSVRLANASGDQVEVEIRGTLKQILEFLDFDSCTFTEFTTDGGINVLCSVAVEGREPFPVGPVPVPLDWFADQTRAGKIVALQSHDDLPPEAIGEAEYFRRSGLRSYLRIPAAAGGRIVGSVSFSAFRSTRTWPDDLTARLKIIGELIAQALARTRSEEALRASEARWRSIFEASVVGIAVIDQNNHFVTANEAFQKMVGYTSEELQSLGPLEITHDDDHDSTQKMIDDAQYSKRQDYHTEKRYRRKDGKDIWVRVSSARHRVAGSTFPIIIEDITEHKRAEVALHDAREALSRATRLTTMGELSASIAHEINQPLASIVTNGSSCKRFLAMSPPNLEEVKDAVHAIVRDGVRASEVISRIRATLKNSAQERAQVDVNQTIVEVLALTRDELQRHRVSVQTDLRSNLPTILADRVQLQQVALNLIMNGIDAMRTVTDHSRILTVRSQLDDRGNIVVNVADSGVGLDPANLERIFETFFTTKPEGMGMGLSICRSIIEAHHGRLWASSGKDHGAVFNIELPTLSPGGE